MENKNEFTHERLTLGGNSIRLITLYPCDNEYSYMYCDITQYPLHRRPGYIALSYMWGSEIGLQPIYLNGKLFMVRRNLYDCLIQLRKVHNEPITLWIDALCIDQDNIPERNHIVRIMDQVYERANQVYVWLGAGDDDSDKAVEFLHEMNASLRADKSSNETFFERYMLPADFHDNWLATIRLFLREYWSRLWIIQETLLAPSLELFCGQRRIPWKDVQEIVVLIEKLFGEYKERKGGSPDLYAAIVNSLAGRMVLRRREFGTRRETYPSLQELLENFKDSICFDQRDDIFGLLGIASDFYKKRNDYIDYNLRPTQVFVNFLQHYLKIPSVDDDEDSLWSLRRLSSRHYSNPYKTTRSEETLWNIRRLSDALRLSVPEILYQRSRSNDDWTKYSDLALNEDDLKLLLPCTMIINLVDDVTTETDPSVPNCALKDWYGSEPRSSTMSTNTLLSPIFGNPPITPFNPGDELAKLRYLARSNGYKVCDANFGPSTSGNKSTTSTSPPFKYFNRTVSKTNPYLRPCFGITCPSARPGDVVVKPHESDLTFVARRSVNGTYTVIGTAVIHDDSSPILKLKTTMRKHWDAYHHRYGSESLSPISAHDRSFSNTSLPISSCPVTPTSSSTPSSPIFEALTLTPTSTSTSSISNSMPVHFNPLTLLMIVTDPNWRKDQINQTDHHLKLHTRKPSSYMAIQPRGDDDPVLRSFGTRIITGMPHVDRGVNKFWDRTVVTVERTKGVRYYFDD